VHRSDLLAPSSLYGPPRPLQCDGRFRCGSPIRKSSPHPGSLVACRRWRPAGSCMDGLPGYYSRPHAHKRRLVLGKRERLSGDLLNSKKRPSLEETQWGEYKGGEKRGSAEGEKGGDHPKGGDPPPGPLLQLSDSPWRSVSWMHFRTVAVSIMDGCVHESDRYGQGRHTP
jgi:hypothetical protein